MAFDPVVYVPRREMALYDGTNSSDIMAYPWSPALTKIDERDGILTVEYMGERYSVSEGQYVVVLNGHMFGGHMPATEVGSSWVSVQVEK